MAHSGLLVDNGITDKTILEQARVLIDELGGVKHVEKMILMPNAKAGLPFAPLSGYLLKCKRDAPFVPSQFNSGTLFASRSIVRLFDLDDDATRAAMAVAVIPAPMIVEAVGSRVTPEWLVYATHRAIATALAIVNEEASKGKELGQFKLIELVPSQNVQCWAALVDEVKESRVQLVVQTHAMPRNDAFLNNIFTPPGGAASMHGKTLLSVFEESRELRQYFVSLHAFRVTVTRLLRYYLIEKILGAEAIRRLPAVVDPRTDRRFLYKADGIRSIRTNTHTSERAAGGAVYFHSECYDLVGEEGTLNNFGLIVAGPYHELIWANANGQSAEAVRAAHGQARFGGAVPSDLPTTMSAMRALESIALVEQVLSAEETKAFEEVTAEEFTPGAVEPGSLSMEQKGGGGAAVAIGPATLRTNVEPGTMGMAEPAMQSDARVYSKRPATAKRGHEREAQPFKTEDGVIVPVVFQSTTPEARVPIFSVSHEFLGEASKNAALVGQHGAMRSQKARCTLAWASNMELPAFVPDIVINYRLGTELPAIRRVLADHGVGLDRIDDLSVNAIGRVMIMAIGPITPLDQLHIWRATYSASLDAYKRRRHHRHDGAEGRAGDDDVGSSVYHKLNTFIAPADEL
jgi:hypothetical protein